MKLYRNFADVPANEWRWPDFQPSEIACRGTGELVVNERAMDMLQELRTRLGKPIHINSGYRSIKHNRAVGGAKGSKHLAGIAFDCRMASHDPQAFMATARAVGFKGIGEYPVLGFCHIDARLSAESWTGSRGKRFPGKPVAPVSAARPAPVAVRAPAQSDPQGWFARIIAAIFGGIK